MTSKKTLVLAIGLLLLLPVISAVKLEADFVIFDGATSRNVFVEEEGLITTAYTAISALEQCIESLASASDAMMEVKMSYGCDETYGGQIASPAILLLSPAPHAVAPCGTASKCLAAYFGIQILGQWAGSVVVSVEDLQGDVLNAISFPFAPHGYGTITGRVSTAMQEDYAIRVHLLDAHGVEMQQRGRLVDIVTDPVPSYYLQTAEAARAGAQFFFLAMATVNPQTPDCLYTISGGWLVNRANGTTTTASPHFLVNKGYTTFMPSTANLAATSACEAAVATAAYREIRPPTLDDPGDWPYV